MVQVIAKHESLEKYNRSFKRNIDNEKTFLKNVKKGRRLYIKI